MPHALQELRVRDAKLTEGNVFEQLFAAVAAFAQSDEGVSIDDVVEHLEESQNLEKADEALNAKRWLVFAILGWQSMLYLPAFNTCALDDLAVHEDDDQSRSGLVFDRNKVSANLSERPLFVLMKAFGNVIPPAPENSFQHASLKSKQAAKWIPLNPVEMNTHFLITLLGIKIRWVDSLSLHFDYNKSTRTLSLFSCPSFCVAALQSKGTIYSFASTEKTSFDPRGNEEDITNILQEILLSYRLLFGQHGPSRKLFPKLYNSTTRLREPDQLLPKLCMLKNIKKTSELQAFTLPDPPIYYAAQHFPMLSTKVEILANELKDSRPTSFKELLHDRRDTLQYWTFWLVSIFGGTSIILSLMQVVLQMVELMRE